MNFKEFLGLGYYTSELDQFLNEYHKTHPKLSASQRREKEKYARIFSLRDIPSESSPQQTIWDKF